MTVEDKDIKKDRTQLIDELYNWSCPKCKIKIYQFNKKQIKQKIQKHLKTH